MKSLTIVYITSRHHPQGHWFLDSLETQLSPGDDVRVIVVDALLSKMPQAEADRYVQVLRPDPPVRDRVGLSFDKLKITAPKPTVWQGKHRVTKEDWWAASNARNTGIALCQTEWLAFLDDRCVLQPGWLDGVRGAMEGNYVVAGAYEKRTGMTVESGIIRNGGIVTGTDSRLEYCRKFYDPESAPHQMPGEWTFGCNLALPLEWALAVNGFEEEHCDGIGSEDSIFGLMLANNGFPMRYDPSMVMIEDRTPSASLPIMRREDKGVSPNDKSHALIDKLRGLKRTLNRFEIRELRNSVLNGGPWPAPTGSTTDWYDGQPLCEF